MVQEQVKAGLKAPEGRYSLRNDKPNACTFHPQRPVRLTFASLQRSDPQQPQQQGTGVQKLIIYNASDALAIAHYGSVDKMPYRQILPGNGSQGLVFPTCHDHYPLVEGYDLVVGLSSGDVVVGSVKAQLNAGGNNVKLLNMLHFNADHSIDKSRTVDVAFVPGTNANCFVAAHESGKIYMYQTHSAVLSGGSPTAKASGSAIPKPVVTISVSQSELTSAAVSPDGTKVASTTKDGVLHVHNLSTGTLLGGFRSHYGGLTCCAWSYDSHYVATGGEDDLVCIYGITEQAQVFWGEGHASWITRVAFDRWESEHGTSTSETAQESFSSTAPVQGREQTRYRIASVAQDCQLLFWDFVVEEDDYMEHLGPESFRASSVGDEPRTHRRTPSSNAVANLSFNSMPGGSAELGGAGFPPEIQPPARKSQMIISTPVLAQQIHYDPCSDLVCMKEALFTATFCCGIKCWLRPAKEPSRPAQNSPTVSSETPKVSSETPKVSSETTGVSGDSVRLPSESPKAASHRFLEKPVSVDAEQR